jgi:hypothetical protein
MKYYIAENGQQAGPFEPSELLMHGLTVNSLVWCEGMPSWTSASQVPELMALLTGQTFNPGGIDTQLPQMPPMGDTQLPPMPQMPPFDGGNQQPAPYGTPYGQGTTNQPYAPPQYGPNTNTPTNQMMPKTWLTESILATAASLLCCFNIAGLVTGVLAIFKANSVKSKFMKGDTAGANQDSASAKKWMMITIAVGVVWSLIQGFRMLNNPSLFQQIKEGAVGSLYGL